VARAIGQTRQTNPETLMFPDLDMPRLAEGVDALAARPAADAAHSPATEWRLQLTDIIDINADNVALR
jgi:hypothetical protein